MNTIKNYTYEDLVESLKTYMALEYIEFINKYYEQAKIIYSNMKRETGEDSILHPINVAYILAELKMDPVTIACALIHEAISLQKMTYEEIGTDTKSFNEETLIPAYQIIRDIIERNKGIFMEIS